MMFNVFGFNKDLWQKIFPSKRHPGNIRLHENNVVDVSNAILHLVFNPSPNYRIPDLSKFKAHADGRINVT